MDLELAGRKVLVTAATRGVGRAIAERFLREGASVAICGRKLRRDRPIVRNPANEFDNDLASDGLEEALAAMTQLGDVRGSVVDCSDQVQVTRWAEQSAGEMGGLDIVVSSASALGGTARTREGWDLSYNTDLMSAVALWNAAYPHFLKSDAPSFVQVSSVAAVEYHIHGDSGQAYGAMKAALINYMFSLAQQYMEQGIRVNCVSPGPTFVEGGSWDFIEQRMPEYNVEQLARQPSGRLGRPEEIADVVAFLASPRASWVIGENVVVDGGYTKHVKF
ncbi:3-ketoacyl-ACP reductase [Novosphingobium marinum]|uniref:NAD(P)-dependent dehydrogenase (Short-subunit alcohol dehydrogenase family) n=1 Tax=Novosphingobium marinum TaxID=1514948 RepID=A0A7Y9Y1P8_9SPHN|nr:SDR family oxidoreductase [Novosphingobium marinum]NYH97108.1 NAD(P)-dependent dehydrogenase (short-subunit alcohol dehydrogenase family) [Novosphingobium marinum]GGC43690.1 3-ketoacyl-ACP reductase [Novosphingobium marinum]